MKKFIVLAAILIAGMVGYSFAFPPAPPGGDMFKSVYDSNNDGIIAPAQGGTGAGTLTDGGILLGSGTGAITALGVATNGQIPIGDGTTDPVLATISGTADEVDVTNGAGTITIGIVNPLAASKGGAGADTSAMTGTPYMTAGVVSLGTQTKSITLNEPTASDDFLIWRTPYAITITAIHGVLLTGTNVVGGIDECDSAGANCVAVDADITFDGGLDSDDGSLTNAAVDAGDWIMWHTTSVSAPGYLTVTIYFQ